MRVVLDASVALLLIDPDAKPPPHPQGQPANGAARARIDHALERLDEARGTVILPTPALTELLALATESVSDIVALLQDVHHFRIAPFDQKAAIECAILLQGTRTAKAKRGKAQASWAKVKFDHQIVAIAKVAGADAIYSDDQDIRRLAKTPGIPVLGVWDLPAPPEDPQGKLDLPSPPSTKPPRR